MKQLLFLVSISFLTIGIANEAKACICVAPTTVTNLSASSITTGGFTLSWTGSTTSCGTMGSYNIDISLTNFGASISGYPLNTGSTSTTKALAGLACGTTYYVRMKAQLSNCGGMQSSSWSSVYSVTTSSPCAATCTDGILNQGETTVDCGGPCLVCTCSDGLQNQGETGVDCGGPCVSCTPPAATTSTVGCPAAVNSTVNPASCDQIGTTALDLSGGVVTYSNKGGATPSPAPSCGTASASGSWARYDLAAGVNTLNFNIDPGGAVDKGNHNVYAAFYQGTCASLSPVNCLTAGETIMGTFYPKQLVVQGLDPAQDVYVYMWDDAGKTFSLPYDVTGSAAPANDGCAGSVTSPDGCNLGSIGDQFATTYSPSWTGAGCVGCGPTYLAGNICGGGTWASNENTVWYSVIASATTASIDIDNIICNDGTAGSAQFAVFTSCACPTVLGWTSNACFKGCATGSGTLSLTGLTAGTTYYLAVDGFAGDVCKYTFTAAGLFTCADTTRPVISSSVAGGNAAQKTFTITLNEPIQCSTLKNCGGCAVNNCTNCDLALSQNGSTKPITGYYIVNATATGCVNDLTTTIEITLNDTPKYTNGVADYDDLWKIVPNSTQSNINLRDTCNNFLLAGNGGPGALILPVELILFNGKHENNSIKLNWVTAGERNVAAFIVEKSKDGVSFVELGKKDGAGNSSTIRSYFLTDSHPFAGHNYYRLYAVTYDGKKEIVGGIIAVEANDLQVFAFNSIQPMPAKDKIVLSVNSDTEDNQSELFIFDMGGRLVYKENRPLLTGNNEIHLDIAFLNKGIYFVTVKKQGQSVFSKLVKYQ